MSAARKGVLALGHELGDDIRHRLFFLQHADGLAGHQAAVFHIPIDDCTAQRACPVMFDLQLRLFHRDFVAIEYSGNFPLLLGELFGALVFQGTYRDDRKAGVHLNAGNGIAGIGADDVFVVVDAWKQSKALLPKETPLPNRISWVHHRAATAMFITSFTTAAAFLSNCVNFVIPVGLFGFFMALLVLLNYLMVISMFPAGIVIYHHWLEERTWKSGLRWKKGPGGAGGGWETLRYLSSNPLGT